MESSAAGSEASFVVLDPPDDEKQSVMKLEIYDYPEDTIASELEEYFSGELQAKLKTSQTEIEQELENKGSLIVEFHQADAKRILERFDHLLDQDEEDSRIRIRAVVPPAPPIRAVHIQSASKINTRMVKKSLKDLEIESLEMLGDSKSDVLVVFKNAEDAERLTEGEKLLQITLSVSASVRLYKALPEEIEVLDTKSTVTVANAEERPDTPMSTDTASSSMTLDLELSGGHDHLKVLPGVADTMVERQISSRTLTPSPLTLQEDSVDPLLETEEKPYTYIEIDINCNEPTEDLYEIIKHQLLQVLKNNSGSCTRYEHSYDDSKRVFRFDMSATDITNFIEAGPHYFDDDEEDSIMKITPKADEAIICLKVLRNPKKAVLTEQALTTNLWAGTKYANNLQIIKLDKTAGALVQMENSSVAALVVSANQHQLPSKMVLTASFDLTLTSDNVPPEAVEETRSTPPGVEKLPPTEKKDVLVSFNENVSISALLLKKYIKSLECTATPLENNTKLIIHFDSVEEARKMVEQEQVEIMTKKGIAVFYEPPEERAATTPESKPTHVEIKCELAEKESTHDVHILITEYLKKELQEFIPTKYEHSYDAIEKVFRFDLSPEETGLLMSQKHLIFQDTPDSELRIKARNTGRTVVVKSSNSGTRLSKTQLKACFGPRGSFASTLIIHEYTNDQATLELETCSVARKLLTMRMHELKNKDKVEVTEFSEHSSQDSEPPQQLERADAAYVKSAIPKITIERKWNQQRNTILASLEAGDNRPAEPTPVVRQIETLLVHNLLDVDEETLSFWVKAVTGLWPVSIHLSQKEESAIVKIPLIDRGLDWNAMQRRIAQNEFHLHGEKLRMERVYPSSVIQVMVSTMNKNSPVHVDVLETYFGNPRSTGVSSVGKISAKRYKDRDDVYTVKYPSELDVTAVMNMKTHKHAGYNFEIAEYYEGVGLCKAKGLVLYNKQPETSDTMIKPSLSVSNVSIKDVDTLKLKMADKTRVRGDEIETFIVINQHSKGTAKVKITYNDDSVAERVYNFHREKPIMLNNKELDIELVSPDLLEYHDTQSVRVSGLTPDLDPEKLKFYISALSDNVVTEMWFDYNRTKAVIKFSNPIDFGWVLCQQCNSSIAACPDIKIHQENKPAYLLAVGDLTKDAIELPLEALLSQVVMEDDYQVSADLIEYTTDKWKIRVGNAAIAQMSLKKMQQKLSGCTHLSIFSEHLGLNVTTGAYKKTKDLSEVVADRRMIDFLLNGKMAGYDGLSKHLQSQGFSIAVDGSITVMLGSDDKQNRRHLLNWRSIDQLVDKFVKAHYLVYETDTLTEQVFSQLVPQVRELTKSLNVICNDSNTKQTALFGANRLSVIGERQTIEDLKTRIEQHMEAIERKIKEDLTIKTVTFPNVKDYQIHYLGITEFFRDMKRKHGLRDIQTDEPNERVKLTGVPSKIEEVQKEMNDILPKLSKSKFSEDKKQLFLRVFSTKLAKESILNEFLNKRVKAVWTLENRTVSMYSESKEKARLAMECLNNVIWEARYPESRDLDELEKQLLLTAVWRDKKEELMKMADPLQIVQIGDKPALSLVGLKYQKGQVLEEIPAFFEEKVVRKATFKGRGKRMSYLYKYNPRLFDDLGKEFSAELKGEVEDDPEVIEISGTSNTIANAMRELKKLHDSVRKGEHTIDVPAMVQHIKDDPDILESVGDKTKCIITLTEKENEVDMNRQQHNAPVKAMVGNFTSYKVVLPSGVNCSVRRGDITNIKCDVIVNAANEDLQHCGGLALAIVQRGGDSIQQECNFFTRRQGKLMVGQAMSSEAGSLPCKKIIHAVGPRWSGGKSEEVWLLRRCIESCFEEMKALKLHSITIPPISTGIFGFPLELAVKTIVETICQLDTKGELPGEVIFIDNKDDSLRCFEKELHSRNAVLPAIASTKPKFTTPTAAWNNNAQPKYTINGKKISILGRVDVEIVSGDITIRQEQSLVNSVGTDMDLRNGKVAPVIAQRAGPQLQRDCSNLAPIQHGEVIATRGYRMPCKQILHCCLPHWGGPASVQALQQVIRDCLIKAASEGHSSIAFPALGTGNLRYPEQNVARCMIETAIDYTEKNPSSTIRDIKIVIYHLDQRTMQEFSAVLFSLKNSNSANSEEKLNLSMTNTRLNRTAEVVRTPDENTKVVGGVKVDETFLRIVGGSITDHNAEIIVNSTDGNLIMGGQVAKALLQKGGYEFSQEIMMLSDTPSNNGVWVSSAGNMTAKYIIHLDSQMPGDSSSKWSKAISACLTECDKRGAASIAFPALGTGQLNIPPKTMSKYIWEAVSTYLSKNPQTCLKAVDIVIFQPAMVHDFEKSMKSAIKSKIKPKGLMARISDWFSSGISVLTGGSGPTAETLTLAAASQGRTLPSNSAARIKYESISLDIYANSEAHIDACKKELDLKLEKALTTEFWNKKPTYSDDKELIKQLTHEQIALLREKAMRLHVTLDINIKLVNIKIGGRPEDVSRMTDLIVKELNDIKKGLSEEKEEKWLAKAIQWSYSDREGVINKFDATTNKLIEERHSKNPHAIFEYKTFNGPATVNLSTMTGHYKGIQFKVTREDLSKPKVIGAELPKSWTAPKDIYQEYVVAPGTPEFIQVESNFNRTRGNVQFQQGVLEVRRVQNPVLYQQYMILRQAVAKKLKLPEHQVETKPLWHGTDQDTVSKITAGKFDRGMAGKNATAFGGGSYFARDSAYSCGYSQPNQSGEQFVIQARVITGEYIKGDNSMKAAPYKNPVIQYDSVVNNETSPSIYVVFHDVAAYPEYIIKFI